MSDIISTATNEASSILGDIFEGLTASVFLKNDLVLNTLGKRIGVGLPFLVGGMFLQGRVLTNRGLAQISRSDRTAVVNNTPMGSLFLGQK